jgi:hypothetical protein
MAAERADVDVAGVSGAHVERTVISLYYAVAVIAISKTECPPFDVTALPRQLSSQSAIKHICIEFSPTVHLVNAARGPGPEEREIQRRTIEDILDAIKTAAYIREREIADEPVRDAVAFEGSECGVAGRDLGSVDELHPAEFERLPGDASQII